MKITDFLVAGDVAAAIAEYPGSFHFKRFSKTSGLTKKSAGEIEKIFDIFDDDKNGFIEKKELKLFLRYFQPDARELNNTEIDSFISAGDMDGDGRIDCTVSPGRHLGNPALKENYYDGGSALPSGGQLGMVNMCWSRLHMS
ncbi:parvalbumin, thymic-like isoform X2 [Narcine bancroftii]|uniref:parvalbumin, thymic-like isoform X2 n=1 Tax=Narcine bancroftii TaxID=1343680 RepID=UPI0038318F5F